jgi:hypothetical protein
METPGITAPDTESDYLSRAEALQRRVADAARALSDRGIRPTVTRIRAALGGGSPNDLAPALKEWKESNRADDGSREPGAEARLPIPVQIADLARELWQRATVAAAVELKGGSAARAVVMRSADTESLRQQMTNLRGQLQQESIAFGELRAQAARYEAMARDALARLDASEARERKQLRELGSARARVAELDATVTQLNARMAVAAPRRPSPRKLRSSKPMRPRLKKPSRARKSIARKTPARARPAPPRTLPTRAKLAIRRTPGPKASRANPRGHRRPRR